jgi:hypothetical protein
MPRSVRTTIDECRKALDMNTGTPTYGFSPRAVPSTKLLSDSSQTSKSACRKARKNISSGDSNMKTGSTPSTRTRPSNRARVRS